MKITKNKITYEMTLFPQKYTCCICNQSRNDTAYISEHNGNTIYTCPSCFLIEIGGEKDEKQSFNIQQQKKKDVKEIRHKKKSDNTNTTIKTLLKQHAQPDNKNKFDKRFEEGTTIHTAISHQITHKGYIVKKYDGNDIYTVYCLKCNAQIKKTHDEIKSDMTIEKDTYPDLHPKQNIKRNNTPIKNSNRKYEVGTTLQYAPSHSNECTGYRIVGYEGYDLYDVECCGCHSLFLRYGETIKKDLKKQEEIDNKKRNLSAIQNSTNTIQDDNIKSSETTATEYQPTKRTITKRDVLIRSTVNRCAGERHPLEDVIMCIKVLNVGSITTIEIPGTYCHACNRYFLLEDNYYLIKQYGTPLCIIKYKTAHESYTSSGMEFEDMNEKSILRLLGYTVNAKDNYSKEFRWEILENAVENDVLTCGEICSHLDFLINRSYYMDNMDLAISKWETDRAHMASYHKKDIRKIEVISLEKIIYK